MNKENLGIEELLNAFVDGELSDKERQHVEHLLSEDAEARELLSQIKQISQHVSALPMTSAPKELVDNVQYELEREFLLGKEDVMSELAGEKHLQVRWLMSAAAVLVLAGVIVTVVVSVLNNPSDTGLPPDPRAVIVGIPDALPDSDAIAALQDKNTYLPEYPYGRLNLSVQPLTSKGVEPTIERFLEAHQIAQVVRNNLDQGDTHYAFHCQVGELDDLIDQLARQNDFRLDF